MDLAEMHALDPDLTKKALEGGLVGASGGESQSDRRREGQRLTNVALVCLCGVTTDFATLDTVSRTWAFKLEADESFAKRFPAVARATKL